jgi:tetratricopeptide (TPR) repeat protein
VSDLVDRAEAALRRLDASTALSLYQGPATGVPEDQRRAGQIRALWLLRRWDEARALLADAAPDSVHTAIARGVIALGQPDEPTFIGFMYRSAKRDDTTAVASFTEAVRLDPTSELAATGLATALRVAGRLADAEAVLTAWLVAPEPSAEILFARAAIAIDRDHVDEAREYLDRTIAADPEDLRAVVRYADLDQTLWGHLLDDRDAAGTPALASLREHRAWRDLELANARGGADRQRLLDAADAGFAASIEAGPALPGAFSGQADVANLRHDRKTARERIAGGLAHEPDSPQLTLDQTDLADGGPKMSRFRQLLDQDPRNLDVRVKLAYFLINESQSGEARRLLADVTEELPDHRALIRANAWLDVVGGHPERGLAGFRRLPRTYVDAINGQMRALRVIGAIEQAEALYEQAVAEPPAGSLVELGREYAYCAMHEGRYEQAEKRARSVLDDVPGDTDSAVLRDAARVRATRRWWRARPTDDRAWALARTARSRARLRAEFIPERVRERTLGRLRALEWELAKLRAGEERTAAQRSTRAQFWDDLLAEQPRVRGDDSSLHTKQCARVGTAPRAAGMTTP